MSNFLKTREYTPKEKQIFWCNRCDGFLVDSANQETGKYFVMFGHSWDQNKKEYDGNYTGVMFALCTECLSKD